MPVSCVSSRLGVMQATVGGFAFSLGQSREEDLQLALTLTSCWVCCLCGRIEHRHLLLLLLLLPAAACCCLLLSAASPSPPFRRPSVPTGEAAARRAHGRAQLLRRGERQHHPRGGRSHHGEPHPTRHRHHHCHPRHRQRQHQQGHRHRQYGDGKHEHEYEHGHQRD